MAEKRCAHRMPVRLPASFRSNQSVIEGWVSDLSRLGLFLRSEFLDPSGASGTIDLELPEGVPLRLPCEVVRVVTAPERCGMAVRFAALPDDTRLPLTNFMIETSYQGQR